ncbi:chaperone [Oleiphilus messinensis]|uniref:Chaperone n=1 Tax=Oleiphilus messinensis TaxID=141451 RepID=A0A1Y0ID74_9GAMM|nr:molecular chaperone [Oleiphilus messinensis]ARU57425.1 chaperone [Oleiphilus messinensis]
MYAGFDYGTSNCAVGVVKNEKSNGGIELLPLEAGNPFMPSALYSLAKELIPENVGLSIENPEEKEAYIRSRSGFLEQARRVRREEGINDQDQSLYFGNAAFDQYFSFPGQGYFVKSPKSYLGASGLRPEFVSFFEDIVSSMMIHVKQQAELNLADTIQHVVIGRPVNFQGLNAEQSNRQAIDILTASAKRAGFKSVEFLYEPLAAGLDFEARLTEDKTVLVVDIGGGTTDCAMVRMGPNHRTQQVREQDFLGHSGERIGGNDLDILLAGRELMPLFGMKSKLKSGLPMPTQVYWDAVSTNNVSAQSSFSSQKTELLLDQLAMDAAEPHLLDRFIALREEKQNFHVVRSAEQCKMMLSTTEADFVDLSYVEPGLGQEISRAQFAQAIERPLAKMSALMDEAIAQAGCRPDLVYLTGGSGKSLDIRNMVAEKLGQVDMLDGNHFGSVTAGLTVWSRKLFA